MRRRSPLSRFAGLEASATAHPIRIARADRIDTRARKAKAMAKAINLAIGDKVAFSAAFLRSTGQFSGRAPALRGTITALDDLGGCVLASIDWHDGTQSRANVKNLARVGSAAMNAN